MTQKGSSLPDKYESLLLTEMQMQIIRDGLQAAGLIPNDRLQLWSEIDDAYHIFQTIGANILRARPKGIADELGEVADLVSKAHRQVNEQCEVKITLSSEAALFLRERGLIPRPKVRSKYFENQVKAHRENSTPIIIDRKLYEPRQIDQSDLVRRLRAGESLARQQSKRGNRYRREDIIVAILLKASF